MSSLNQIGHLVLNITISKALLSFFSILALSSLVQAVYGCFFHPLSKFPGPRVAAFTNLWKTYQVAAGDFEGVLLRLHQKHGKIVRIGPNHLDISDAQAVKVIFGSGRTFQKR